MRQALQTAVAVSLVLLVSDVARGQEQRGAIDGSSGAEDAYDQLEPGFSLSGPLVRGAFPGGAKMPEC